MTTVVRVEIPRWTISIIGAALWILLGWDGRTWYSGLLPGWDIYPEAFYFIAGLILIVYGATEEER